MTPPFHSHGGSPAKPAPASGRPLSRSSGNPRAGPRKRGKGVADEQVAADERPRSEEREAGAAGEQRHGKRGHAGGVVRRRRATPLASAARATASATAGETRRSKTLGIT